jgi:mRNA interferase MazF
MTRGDVVVVAMQGDNGKPRPAVVVQNDDLIDSYSVVLVPLTSDLVAASQIRVQIEPRPETGLRLVSQAMIDRVGAARREVVGQVIGRLTDADMDRIDTSLAYLLGLD